MDALDLRALDERLRDGDAKEYWIQLDTSGGIDKYPGELTSFGLKACTS